MPMDIKRGIYISSYYGYRDDPFNDRRQFHAGDDFSAKIGTPVKCTGDGVVTKAQFDTRFGNFIEIDHGYGYKTQYAHLNRLAVKEGQKVKRGEVIGYVRCGWYFLGVIFYWFDGILDHRTVYLHYTALVFLEEEIY